MYSFTTIPRLTFMLVFLTMSVLGRAPVATTTSSHFSLPPSSRRTPLPFLPNSLSQRVGPAIPRIPVFKTSRMPSVSIAVGITQVNSDDYQVLSHYRPENNTYKKLVIKDNILKGAVLVGDIANAGVFSALIRNRTDISQIKDQLMEEGFSYGNFLRKAVRGLSAI